MICKLIKLGMLSVAGVVLVGGIVFGREMCSYVSSSARSVRHAVKDAVPVEFELRRARAEHRDATARRIRLGLAGRGGPVRAAQNSSPCAEHRGQLRTRT